ncbi:hypothetical protein FQE99_11910 [Escherichia coli]|nr:hypothetical protein [Escherichia coli]EFN9316858.1 hypothetical protein [Escherichia coli]MDN1742326.1 hypothetical protein [Escherichia coli]RCX67543.1 hypothetical protein DTL34_08970 [Escherichia coli]RCZ38748.1 hypothetical protein DTL76_04885 [Escherichia coli]
MFHQLKPVFLTTTPGGTYWGIHQNRKQNYLEFKLLIDFLIPAGDTRYPSNQIYLHPVKDGFGSTLALYLLIFTATG